MIGPFVVRAVAAIAGVALLVLPSELHPVPFVLTLAGVAAALSLPRLVGASLASGGFVIAWLAAGGWDAVPSVPRTVAAAAALYVLHTATALAATTPHDARLEREVWVRWVRRCVVPVIVGAALIGVDEALPRRGGSAWFAVAGLVAVLAIAAVLLYSVGRREPDGGATPTG